MWLQNFNDPIWVLTFPESWLVIVTLDLTEFFSLKYDVPYPEHKVTPFWSFVRLITPYFTLSTSLALLYLLENSLFYQSVLVFLDSVPEDVPV